MSARSSLDAHPSHSRSRLRMLRACAVRNPVDPGWRVSVKSSSREDWRFQHGGERLRRGPSEGSPTENALYHLSVEHSHVVEGAGGVSQASSDHNKFPPGIGRQGTKRFFPPVFQNEGDGLPKVRQTFFPRPSLAVGAWQFGAVCDVPRAVLLNNRGELVVHASILAPYASRNSINGS